MQTSYPGFVNSPSTTLTGDLTDSTTDIPVAETLLFAATGANLAVIGTGEDAETILFQYKTTLSGAGILKNCTREFNKTGTYGAKKAWSTGSVISRQFTDYDMQAATLNIAELVVTIAGKAPSAFYEYLRFPAGQCLPPSVNNAPVDVGFSLTGDNAYAYINYTQAGEGTLRQLWVNSFQEDFAPADATLGKIQVKIKWLPTSGSGDVKFQVNAILIPDNGSIATAPVYLGTITDTLQTVEQVHETAYMAASVCTSAGSGGFTIILEVLRVTVAGDIAADVRVLEVVGKYIRTPVVPT